VRKSYTNIKKFFNNSGLLPHNTKLDKISSRGVFFIDGNGADIDVIGLSDGFRSILSLTFELIRQLIRVYGAKEVFKNFSKDNYFIDLQGVVLIDEIDVHLHPTWQTRIGEWFTKYFPQLQFIVATHSPLICRACREGTIWRLAAPASNSKSGEIIGVEKDRLVYGNVLDAYGTEVFGQNVTRSQEAHEKLNRLARLNMLHTVGKISEEEKIEMYHLRQIFTTDDTTTF
jgi:predicted ATP-binding protein involved in virulence